MASNVLTSMSRYREVRPTASGPSRFSQKSFTHALKVKGTDAIQLRHCHFLAISELRLRRCIEEEELCETSSAAMSLVDMPVDVLCAAVTEAQLTPRDLCALAGSCKSLHALLHRADVVWTAATKLRFGPVKLPSKEADAPSAAIDEAPSTAIGLLVYLESVFRPLLRISVRKACAQLIELGIVEEGEWHETFRCLLRWVPLSEKRRITAFVCADWQPPKTLATFLAPMRIAGETPLAALRSLLMRFPFLPIDAGAGADRVIGYIARAYALHNSDCLAVFGIEVLPAHTATTPGVAANVWLDESDEAAGFTEATFKAARDAVYTFLYSVIMLNTDLHNPAITPTVVIEIFFEPNTALS